MRRSPFPSASTLLSASLFTIFILAVFGVLKWLQIPTGEWMDWLFGVAGFWWLLGVTTIPWRIHFSAEDVLRNHKLSIERGLEPKKSDYVAAQKISTKARSIAIGLHLFSAVGFAALAHFGFTPLGWFASVAAILLTFVQPLARLYAHIADTLSDMRHDARFPRDDVQTLKEDLMVIESRLEPLNRLDPTSWINDLDDRLDRIETRLSELDNAVLASRRESEKAYKHLHEDTEFIGNVRDLIRFFKQV